MNEWISFFLFSMLNWSIIYYIVIQCNVMVASYHELFPQFNNGDAPYASGLSWTFSSCPPPVLLFPPHYLDLFWPPTISSFLKICNMCIMGKSFSQNVGSYSFLNDLPSKNNDIPPMNNVLNETSPLNINYGMHKCKFFFFSSSITWWSKWWRWFMTIYHCDVSKMPGVFPFNIMLPLWWINNVLKWNNIWNDCMAQYSKCGIGENMIGQ